MAFYRCGGGADTSIVTAAASDVLSPKVIVDAEGNPLTGTMPNNGAVSSALNCGGSYTIPKGYHNGSGKVTANSLASQTSADAAAGNILSGKTAWVNGSKVTGTMTNNGAVTKSLSEGSSYTIPAGYHNGSGKVTAKVTTKSGSFNLPAFTETSSSWKTFLTIADVPSYPTMIRISPNSKYGYGIRQAYKLNLQQTEFKTIGYIEMLFEYDRNHNIAHAYFDNSYDICRPYGYGTKPDNYYTEFQSIYNSTAKTVTIQCRNTHSSMYLVVENSETWGYTLYGSFS